MSHVGEGVVRRYQVHYSKLLAGSCSHAKSFSSKFPCQLSLVFIVASYQTAMRAAKERSGFRSDDGTH